MRSVAAFAFLCACTFVSAAEPPLPKTHAFENGHWFDGTAFVRRTAYARHGRLQFDRPKRIDVTVDLKGGYVVAPFCEAHNHNLGLAYQNEAGIARYLDAGIFYVKILSNLPRETGSVRHTYNHARSVDVSFANGGITGPGGHPIKLRERLLDEGAYPAFTRETLRDHAYFVIDSPADVDAKWPLVLDYRPDFIKTFLVHSQEYAKRRDDLAYFGAKGMNPDLLPLIVTRAHQAGLRVSTHVSSAADFRAAVHAGVDEVAHLPGSSTIENIEAADARDAARKGITVVTTAILIERRKEKEPDLYHKLRAAQITNLRILSEAGVSLAAGSDEFDATSADEVRHLHSLGVFDNRTLLRLWTTNCAKTVFPDRHVGQVAEGFEASFIVLQGNPLLDWSSTERVRYLFKDGRQLERQSSASSGPGAAQ